MKVLIAEDDPKTLKPYKVALEAKATKSLQLTMVRIVLKYTKKS